MPQVYFIRPVGQEGPVKIGHSRLPFERLRACLAWSPVELEIVATISGGRTLEGRFHSAFMAHHVRGEWFGPAPEITATIAAVQAGTFDVDALPVFATLRVGWKPPPESIQAGINNRKIQALAKAGIPIPKHVEAALHTYQYPPEEVARRRAIVRDFIHGLERA